MGEEDLMMGQPKPNPVKKSKCKVGGLKPELKNEMVKKKPAFHWNKPPKPDFLVKTTFFEAKREEFRDFEMPPDSTSPIPGLQIADFTVSRARVRGRSRKVSLDENSLLAASPIGLGASKSDQSASKQEVCANPIDLCNRCQTKKTDVNTGDTTASEDKLLNKQSDLCAKAASLPTRQAKISNNSAKLPTSCTNRSANPSSLSTSQAEMPTNSANLPTTCTNQSANPSSLSMPKQEALFSDIFFSSSEEEAESVADAKTSSTVQSALCVRVPNNNNNDNNKRNNLTFVDVLTANSSNNKKLLESLGSGPNSVCVKGSKGPGCVVKQIPDLHHLAELVDDNDKGESGNDQGDVGVIWATRSHLNNLQKELADARAKKIAYMALIMALDNIKLGIPW